MSFGVNESVSEVVNGSLSFLESSPLIDVMFAMALVFGVIFIMVAVSNAIRNAFAGADIDRKYVIEANGFEKTDTDKLYRKRPRIEEEVESFWAKIKRLLTWGM